MVLPLAIIWTVFAYRYKRIIASLFQSTSKGAILHNKYFLPHP